MANVAMIISQVAVALIGVLLAATHHRIPRTRGRVILYHIIYGAVATVSILFLPKSVRLGLFSPLGCLIIGTAFPIYGSIRAVCTPGGEDDKSWLQYWIMMGIILYTTYWLDDMAKTNDAVRERWYEVEFAILLWLLLPYTDGAALVFDKITGPLLTPVIKPLSTKCGSSFNSAVSFVISASHLWVIWVFFVFLKPGLKRIVTVSVGTIYPLMASVVAVTTEVYDDDTFWLTYWSCYGCLYFLMDFLETWLGKIPGFYSVVLFASVYLMLPMFEGADKFFRKVLVPLAGLQEMLLLRDALAIKKVMMKSIPADRVEAVRSAVARSFAKDANDDKEENDPLMQLGAYGSIDPIDPTV